MSRTTRSLDAMPLSECVALLRTAEVGRVVFTVGGLPAIVPVAFGVDGEAVLIRTGADGRLASAADGGVLAFEVDDLDPATHTAWSVVVTGIAELVTDLRERQVAEGIATPWAPGHYDVVVRLPLSVVSGRRVTCTPDTCTSAGHQVDLSP